MLVLRDDPGSERGPWASRSASSKSGSENSVLISSSGVMPCMLMINLQPCVCMSTHVVDGIGKATTRTMHDMIDTHHLAECEGCLEFLNHTLWVENLRLEAG